MRDRSVELRNQIIKATNAKDEWVSSVVIENFGQIRFRFLGAECSAKLDENGNFKCENAFRFSKVFEKFPDSCFR